MRTTRIGPYQLGDRVGSGGMGEVYRAFDQRLERWVALKQIRPESADDADRRQRFRLEARAAARLGHPAVVQVHDLVESESGDWIVMELVTGSSLAERLKTRTMPLAEGLALARQIAAGLAHAHQLGIVHRDLKAENVIVTDSGQAKILDFGVAKRLDIDDGVTVDGQILGTLRAMSPEQSRGLPVDPRSDLFALGVLLYEMFSGITPFHVAGEPLATLERIRTHQPPPLKRLVPAVPRALSDVVDRLLEKNPARRPATALEVIDALEAVGADATAPPDPHGGTTYLDTEERPASQSTAFDVARFNLPHFGAAQLRLLPSLALAVVLLLLVGLGSWSWSQRSRPPIYVAVEAPRHVSTDPPPGEAPPDPERLGESLRASLLGGMVALQGAAPLTGDGLDPRPQSASDLARALSATEVVTTSFSCRQHACRVDLRRLHSEDGRLLKIESFDVPVDDERLLRAAVVDHTQRIFPELTSRAGARTWDVSSESYARFLDLRRALRGRTMALEPLLEEVADLRRQEPGFTEVLLLEADVAHNAFFYSRREEHLQRALDRLSEARKLAPDEPRVLVRRLRIALTDQRLELARETLATLEELTPGDIQLQAWRAQLLELEGQPTEALRLLRRSAERFPNWVILFDLASMEYRQGELDAARATLGLLLERVPGNVGARSFLAQLELLEGSLATAIELYRGLVERTPGVAELSNLGLAHMLSGDFAAAATSFERARDLAPDNPIMVLNLADARQLLGDEDEARVLYRRVTELATADETDWQQLTVLAQAHAHLGDHRAAAGAVQQALQRAPRNPQAAFEAAVVYALIGERASALVNVENARAGFDPRWFGLPWFNDLRHDPEFQRLLEPD